MSAYNHSRRALQQLSKRSRCSQSRCPAGNAWICSVSPAHRREQLFCKPIPLTSSRWFVSRPNEKFNYDSSPTTIADQKSVDRAALSIFDMDATTINATVETAEDLEILVDQLEEMESLSYTDIQTLIRPLIQVCKRIREKDRAADLAERILFNCLARLPSEIAERFATNQNTSDPSTMLPYPDHALYTKVMSIVGNLRSAEAANRVNRLFRLMTAEHRAEFVYMQQTASNPDDYPNRAAEPNFSTFKSLLRAWSIAGTATGAKEAENVLVEMETLSGLRPFPGSEANHSISSIAPPDVECYNMVLTSYSRVNIKRHPLVADRFHALCGRMQQLEEEGRFRLGWFSYHAYLKSIDSITKASKEKLDDCLVDNLLKLAPRLCTVAVPDSFLRRFQEEGVHPRAWALGILVKATLHGTTDKYRLKRSDTLVRQMVGEVPFDDLPSEEVPLSQLWPSQATLVELSTAWRQSELPDAQRALERIKSLATESSYLSLHHNHIAMTAWEESRSPDGPEIVQALLDRILDPSSRIEPTGETFAIAMRTWIGSDCNERASKVEDLLFLMHKLYHERQSSRYLANETHLGLTLQAWQELCKDGKRYKGKHGFLYPAEHACLHLEYLRSSNVWDPRNYTHYSTCIKAWSQQVVDPDDREKLPAREAAALLADLEERAGECPPAPHCNMVLQACLRSDLPEELKKEAYNIAMTTFNKGSHDPFSFILAVEIIKRFANEFRADHLQFIEAVVRTCRDSGRLTQTLIYEAVEVLGKEQLMRLFNFSEWSAEMIVQNRSAHLVRSNGKKLQWKGRHPQGLRLNNLPRSWSQNLEYNK